MNVHDDHYRRIEGRGVEPIEVAETIICNGIPPEFHAAAKRNYNLTQATKYFMRLGEKDHEEKELAKAQNYLHRARTGHWEWQMSQAVAAAPSEPSRFKKPESWALQDFEPLSK